MKKLIDNLLVLSTLTLTFNLQTAICSAQGTAFTYQGRLNSDGTPANGSYDIAFSLYTNSTGSVAIAGPVTNSAVGVTNGLFTTMVDFGNVFTGGSNWLEIAVSTNGANNFTTLAPRQQLTPVPYAVFAAGANAAGLSGTISPSNIASESITSNQLANGSVNVSQLSTNIGVWTRTGSNIFYNAGNVGVGTSSPGSSFEVSQTASGITSIFGRGADPSFNINMFQSNLDNSTSAIIGGLGLSYGAGIYDAAIRFHRGSASTGGFISFTTGNNTERVRIDGNGDVGIGTTNLASPLTVNGNIQMGSGGTNYAASGVENLRIVRGSIYDDGTTAYILHGSGFTAAHPSLGAWVITFNPPFSSPPTVTVTAHALIGVANNVTATDSSIAIQIESFSATPQYDSFGFIAVGPR